MTQPSTVTRWERNFIEQMVRLREARQMTQSDIARALKSYGLPFHQPTVQRIEAGERPVRLNEAYLIAKVLGVPIDAMTGSGVHIPDITAELSRRVAELEKAVNAAHRTLGEVAS